MADALGVNRATYSYYELGTTAPDFQRIVEIACKNRHPSPICTQF